MYGQFGSAPHIKKFLCQNIDEGIRAQIRLRHKYRSDELQNNLQLGSTTFYRRTLRIVDGYLASGLSPTAWQLITCYGPAYITHAVIARLARRYWQSVLALRERRRHIGDLIVTNERIKHGVDIVRRNVARIGAFAAEGVAPIPP